MTTLRLLAIASNIAFVGYGWAAGLWPILLLHVVMLALNLRRLREALDAGSPRKVPPAKTGQAAIGMGTRLGARL